MFNEQGRPQLGKGWSSAEGPQCKGFTPEEFQN
nr:conjugal transfer protein TraN [Campylobacter jejuni]